MIARTACKPEMQHLKVQQVSLVNSLHNVSRTDWPIGISALIVSILVHMYLTMAKMASKWTVSLQTDKKWTLSKHFEVDMDEDKTVLQR